MTSSNPSQTLSREDEVAVQQLIDDIIPKTANNILFYELPKMIISLDEFLRDSNTFAVSNSTTAPSPVKLATVRMEEHASMEPWEKEVIECQKTATFNIDDLTCMLGVGCGNDPEMALNGVDAYTAATTFDPKGYHEPTDPIIIPCNKHVIKLVEKLHVELKRLSSMTRSLRVNITLLLPKITGGNSPSIEAQENLVQELGRVENALNSQMTKLMGYYAKRGQVLKKLLKYPKMDDYRNAIRVLDDSQFFFLRLSFMDLRNHCLYLYDRIVKNLDLITKKLDEGEKESRLY